VAAAELAEVEHFAMYAIGVYAFDMGGRSWKEWWQSQMRRLRQWQRGATGDDGGE
jgi:hypothetical protein